MANAVAERARPAEPTPAHDAPVGPRARTASTTRSSSHFDRRLHVFLLLVFVLLSLLLAAVAASVALGSRTIPVSAIWEALFRPSGDEASVIVHEMRIPRTLAGIVAGAGLAVSGVLLQTLNRNPLADPHIQGLNAGAALAVVLAITTLDIADPIAFALFGLIGAASSGTLVHVVAIAGRGKPTPERLALAGAAITAMLSAVTSAILLLDVTTLDRFRFWVAGSLAIPDTDAVLAIAPFLLAGLVIATASTRQLDLLLLDDDVAVGLGARRGRARALVALAAVLLAGASVSLVGPIGFVGLAAPHIARRLVGTEHRRLLPCTAIIGSCLLLSADVVGRIIARPTEVEAGIVTALVGVPVFVALIRRRTQVAR